MAVSAAHEKLRLPSPVGEPRIDKEGWVYVTEFGLSSVRGFHGARAVDALALPQPGDGGSWTVIAGRNGSGKSTLLRALALALAGPRVARSLTQNFGGWITTGVSVPPG
ncbi:AAA family ATPase [Streptomyces sp. NPDC059456]|uniref:AAA family ATPase n=1 Tax=Streptomyces sp. NPDC059456 TaxID=3346838 RepID=UPI0036A11616